MELEFSIAPEAFFYLGPLPVTNTLLISWLIVLGLVVFSLFFIKKLRPVPVSRSQIITEAVFEALVNFINSILQDKKLAAKVFPLIATIFIFVLMSNWVELIPGLGTIGLNAENQGQAAFLPFIRSSSADLNLTLALALISFFSIQFFGIASIGAFKYFRKFLNFRNPMSFVIGLLELVSEVTKIISFSFRLFGNIFAGEVLLLVVLFMTPYLVPLPFLAFEIFVGLIQAFIFAMLTLIFVKVAVMETPH